MENIIEKIGLENLIIGIVAINVILLIIVVINSIAMAKLKKRYTRFMNKFKGDRNIEEDLENYLYKIERIENQNGEILGNIKNIENDLSKCIQKVGIYRYSAFKDVGSDLSFTLALLDENNNGAVLNGIYSREMSNIYAKSVENGKSKHTLSEEEQEAIKIAIESDGIYRIK
ncbi:MAG: DUF4446 family protein [Clostridia bacterium]|nr:DUF4446 family protein [Clostridia bacterium]